MGRKKSTFYEVREGDKGYEIVLNTEHADAIADLEGAGERRPERGPHREAMKERKDLANELAALPYAMRCQLPLDEMTLDILHQVSDAGRTPARRRLIMRLKLLLRDADMDALQEALDGNTEAAMLTRDLERWRTKILAGGDEEIHAFLARYPAGDAQQIRAIAREARGVEGGPQVRRLYVLLKKAAAQAPSE